MSISVDRDDPGIRVLISRSPGPIREDVQVSGIDHSPQVVNNAGVGTWRSLVAHLNGVQGQGKTLWPFFYAGFSLRLTSHLVFPLVQELQDLHSKR